VLTGQQLAPHLEACLTVTSMDSEGKSYAATAGWITGASSARVESRRLPTSLNSAKVWRTLSKSSNRSIAAAGTPAHLQASMSLGKEMVVAEQQQMVTSRSSSCYELPLARTALQLNIRVG
jgi:hypothetical protein